MKRVRATIDAANEQTKTAPPPVTLKRASEVELKPISWLWDGYIPRGMFALLGGAPGSGKTTIMMSMAATVSTAGSWPDGKPCREPSDVLIWTGEDLDSVLTARLKAHHGNLNRVHFISGTNGSVFDPATDFVLLAESLKGIRPALLIIDPIVSAINKDAHRSNDVRRGLQPLVDLAETLNCAVVGITHFSKGTQGRDVTERITGSVAFTGLARVVLVAAKAKPDDNENDEPQKEKRVLLRAKSNIGADTGGFEYSLERKEVAPGIEGQCVVWGKEITGNARDILAEAEAETSQTDSGYSEPSQVEQFLREVLKAGAMPVSEIKLQASEAGIPFRLIQRKREQLGIETSKIAMASGWQWSLPEDTKIAPKKPKIPAQNSVGTFGTFGEKMVSSTTDGVMVEVL